MCNIPNPVAFPPCIDEVEYFNRWRRGLHNNMPNQKAAGISIDAMLAQAKRQHTALNCLRSAGLPPEFERIVCHALGVVNA